MKRRIVGVGVLFIGFTLGATLGLLYAWVISPVRFVEAAPASLGAASKEIYRSLIAASFSADADLSRARARLGLLGDGDPVAALAAQAQNDLANGGSVEGARSLALLASALGNSANVTATAIPLLAVASPSPSPASPTATAAMTSTPSSTQTLSPTSAPSPTARPAYELHARKPVCSSGLATPLIQVVVHDHRRQPVPGMAVHVVWKEGEETFFTGLQPSAGAGYADFAMTPGVVYTLQLVESSEPVGDLSATECQPGGGGKPYWGGWLVEFSQP
ncbi:MAG: hypothetical protein PHQ40_04330 [Anaerolineaceae bacterium]|nr:hypothetical protein [Anaerolineaceae bacterium]